MIGMGRVLALATGLAAAWLAGWMVAAGAPVSRAPAIGTPIQVAIPVPCTSTGDNSTAGGGCSVWRAGVVTQPGQAPAVEVLYWPPGASTGIALAGVLPCPVPTGPCWRPVPR